MPMVFFVEKKSIESLMDSIQSMKDESHAVWKQDTGKSAF